jgi:hypothetical protein
MLQSPVQFPSDRLADAVYGPVHDQHEIKIRILDHDSAGVPELGDDLASDPPVWKFFQMDRESADSSGEASKYEPKPMFSPLLQFLADLEVTSPEFEPHTGLLARNLVAG